MACEPKKPCGRHFCPAAVRMVWDMHDWSTPEAAAVIAVTPGALWKRADALDLPARPWIRSARLLSRSKVREVWLRNDVPLARFAADMGVSVDTLQRHAQATGDLPRRKSGPKPQVAMCRWFAEMWHYGVSTRSLADHMGCAQGYASTLAHRAGLPQRRGASRYVRKPTVADFMRDELPRLILAAHAAETAAAMRLSEMVDAFQHRSRAA
jgi:hypothetical protein